MQFRENLLILKKIKLICAAVSAKKFREAHIYINIKIYSISLLSFAILMVSSYFFLARMSVNGAFIYCLLISTTITYLIWISLLDERLISIDDYLDELLVLYQPKDEERFNDLINSVNSKQQSFIDSVSEWCEKEISSLSTHQKEKEYRFTKKTTHRDKDRQQ